MRVPADSPVLGTVDDAVDGDEKPVGIGGTNSHLDGGEFLGAVNGNIQVNPCLAAIAGSDHAIFYPDEERLRETGNVRDVKHRPGISRIEVSRLAYDDWYADGFLDSFLYAQQPLVIGNDEKFPGGVG